MLLSLATQLSVNNVMPNHSNHMDHSHLDNHVNNIILLNPDGDFAGIFRPPFDISRLSLTYQSITNFNLDKSKRKFIKRAGQSSAMLILFAYGGANYLLVIK